MPTCKTSELIRTGRNIKGFRSCQRATGECCERRDRARIRREDERLAAREEHHLSIAGQWAEHFDYVAGPLRVLPPSARARHAKER